MIGQLVFGSGGPRQGEREKLYGLPVLRVRADMDSFWWERRVKKAGRALFRGGARRVLVPRGFPCWPLLSEYGLAPVDPGPFLRAQSPALALALLERRGAAPDRSTVVLCGARADWEMTRVAVTLCSQVRNLVIDAPKGGEELARWLRGEFGVPILPRREGGRRLFAFIQTGPGERSLRWSSTDMHRIWRACPCQLHIWGREIGRIWTCSPPCMSSDD